MTATTKRDEHFRVIRIGRTWSVVDARGVVVEGGFFARAAAERCRDDLQAGAR